MDGRDLIFPYTDPWSLLLGSTLQWIQWSTMAFLPIKLSSVRSPNQRPGSPISIFDESMVLIGSGCDLSKNRSLPR
jgi:hypothetical protein